ncbi:winged helix-turn-helix transcriptional regulator [Sphingomonas xinjiangensis]|uniref:DNA-binding HxlR family transcriptional regulator n=1 Tax=Sphingomonas xinjiangensis TaxID=643568 RepID=A0A840YCG2_9SPHN|nr:winged helix-turn-helix transcriptional regulator [Sphingomonas xinjiangensis]MBB5709985.1 DNA-binding HxlR family transcriptional regulator [Sphingomonas xinjiangensis]
MLWLQKTTEELEKITKVDFNKARRWYQDACGTALAMDLIGERWSLLIVRELLLGPRRFGEIRGALTGLSANILTQRLEGLEKGGVLRRETLPPPVSAQVYALTAWGRALETPIFALSRWAAGSPAHDVTMPLSNTAFMLSLRTMMDPQASATLSVDLGFRIGGDEFRGLIADGQLAVRRAPCVGAELGFEGEPSPLAAVFYGPAPLADSQAAGKVEVTGDLAVAQQFVDLFRLPAFPRD